MTVGTVYNKSKLVTYAASKKNTHNTRTIYQVTVFNIASLTRDPLVYLLHNSQMNE